MLRITVLLFALMSLIACTTSREVEFYEITKPLSYRLDGGDGVGHVSDTMIPGRLTLDVGTRIKIVTRKGHSFVTGTAYYNSVHINSGQYRGNEIYLWDIKDQDACLRRIK